MFSENIIWTLIIIIIIIKFSKRSDMTLRRHSGNIFLGCLQDIPFIVLGTFSKRPTKTSWERKGNLAWWCVANIWESRGPFFFFLFAGLLFNVNLKLYVTLLRHYVSHNNLIGHIMLTLPAGLPAILFNTNLSGFVFLEKGWIFVTEVLREVWGASFLNVTLFCSTIYTKDSSCLLGYHHCCYSRLFVNQSRGGFLGAPSSAGAPMSLLSDMFVCGSVGSPVSLPSSRVNEMDSFACAATKWIFSEIIQETDNI